MATFFPLAEAHEIAEQCAAVSLTPDERAQSGDAVCGGNGTYTSTVDGWTYRVVPCRDVSVCAGLMTREQWSLHSDGPAFKSPPLDHGIVAVFDDEGRYVGALGDNACRHLYGRRRTDWR